MNSELPRISGTCSPHRAPAVTPDGAKRRSGVTVLCVDRTPPPPYPSARNAAIASATASGRSNSAMWPAPGTISTLAGPEMASAMRAA